MADGSKTVVYAALAGNVAVAISKYGAAAVSGSSAMLTEAVHSTADCTNQLLLLIGIKRGKLPPDPSHPFGYGMEIYFWTFIVAVLVLLAGGVFSVYTGLKELAAPAPIGKPVISLVVLFASALFDGGSFVVSYRQFKRIVSRDRRPGAKIGLIQFIQWSKDPSMYESILEDGAALIGVAIATVGVIANAYFHLFWGDGAASIAIGLMLAANAVGILIATRSLVAGEAVVPPLLDEFWKAARAQPGGNQVCQLDTLHLGPTCILIAATLRPSASTDSYQALTQRLEKKLIAVDPRVTEVLFRFAPVKGDC